MLHLFARRACWWGPYHGVWGGDTHHRHRGRPALGFGRASPACAGLSKNTYGTGCFALLHTGERMPVSTSAAADEPPPPAPPASPSRAKVSSPARHPWLRDKLASSPLPLIPSRWPSRRRIMAAFTWSRPSSVWARHTGIQARRSPGSPQPPAGRTSCGRRSSPSLTRHASW